MTFKYLDHLFKALACFLALGVSSVAHSATITEMYIFGDSLSDTNVGLSNGDLWPVYFAPQVGITYDAANNYAVAGAAALQLASQVSAYQADNPTADPNALYVVWAGANDIGAGISGTDAANSVINTISTLSTLGAQNFLVPNMADLGAVPGGTGPLSSIYTNESILFNATIDAAYSASSNALIADIFGFYNDVQADPAAFGFTNVTEGCRNTGADCSTYFFWDSSHPTTLGHSYIADTFSATVSAVPVPAAVWLFSSGLLGLIGVARRKKAA